MVCKISYVFEMGVLEDDSLLCGVGEDGNPIVVKIDE